MFEREIRDLAHVPRWTIARVLKRQSVAEHTFFVAMYALQIAEIINWCGIEERYQLVMHALHHDLHESFTGDTPGPVKRSVYDGGASKQWIMEESERRFSDGLQITIDPQLQPEIDTILKVANLLDELFYILGETQLGNRSLFELEKNVRVRVKRSWRSLPGYSEDTLDAQWAMYVEPAIIRELQGTSETVTNDADLAL